MEFEDLLGTQLGLASDGEGPNSVDIRRLEAVARSTLPVVTRAASAAKPCEVRRVLIPVYLTMDKELSAAGEPIACRAGCDWCCHFRVSVTAMEAFALAEHLQTRPPADRERLTGRLRATVAEVSTMTQDVYLRTNVPCAFLEGGTCSVYAMRPAACRGFHSIDVETCKSSYNDADSNVPMTIAPDRQAVSEAYRDALQVGQHNAGRDGTTYEMHAAVAEALDNPTASKRWKRGKVAFLSVRDRDPVAGP